MYNPRMLLMITKILSGCLLICLFPPGRTGEKFTDCLPKDIKLGEIVSAPELKPATKPANKKATVKEILLQLKAHCEKGRLVDGEGKEIHFYRLIGCWGNPPEDYQEQLARQNEELQRLRKKYTVVEISCAQRDPRQIQ